MIEFGTGGPTGPAPWTGKASAITALEIHTNGGDIKCSAGGPDKNGKYTGWIELWRNGDLHKPMLSTQPVYDTEEEATRVMESIVSEVRALSIKEIMLA
jgi:hypothetical protein